MSLSPEQLPELNDNAPAGLVISAQYGPEGSPWITLDFFRTSQFGYELDLSQFTDNELLDYPTPGMVMAEHRGIRFLSDEHAAFTFFNDVEEHDLVDYYEVLMDAAEKFAIAVIAEQLRVDGLKAGA